MDDPPTREPDDVEVACFEAGIKFGSLYHQFAGTPISPESASSLAAAMEAAIENQPHCVFVSVQIDDDALADAVDPDIGYTELTGRFLDVTVGVDYQDVVVEASMDLVDGYPLMRVDSVSSAG